VPRLEEGNPQGLLPLAMMTRVFSHQWRPVSSLKFVSRASMSLSECPRASASKSVKVERQWLSPDSKDGRRLTKKDLCYRWNSFIKQYHNISNKVPQLVLNHDEVN